MRSVSCEILSRNRASLDFDLPTGLRDLITPRFVLRYDRCRKNRKADACGNQGGNAMALEGAGDKHTIVTMRGGLGRPGLFLSIRRHCRSST